jgi:hypothetical protein
MNRKEMDSSTRKIKKRLEEKDLWIETRSQGEDVHILVGKRDGTGNKVHIVVDGKTAEIRIEDNQIVPQGIIKLIESTLTLNDGRVVRFSRELLDIASEHWQNEVDGFSIHVVQVGGVGSRVYTSTAQLLTEHGYLPSNKFVVVAFTNGGDMLIGPKTDFEIVEFGSPSGNKVEDDGLPKWCRLILEDKLRNEIVMTCKKAPAKGSI